MKAKARPAGQQEGGLLLDRRELLGAALLAAGRPLGVSELGGLLGLSAAKTTTLVAAYDAALLAMGAGFRF